MKIKQKRIIPNYGLGLGLFLTNKNIKNNLEEIRAGKNEDMRLGLEFGYRKTFTDYIDDVSTSYVDQTSLLNARGQTAVDLAWRCDEKSGGSYPAAGTVRGNSKNKDGYYYVALTYTLRFFFDKYKQIVGLPSVKPKKLGCPESRQ
jgi:hypothetical protein